MERGGGLVPAFLIGGDVPLFTLYGDGTAIYRSSDAGGARTPHEVILKKATLTGEQSQALLRFALDAGRLMRAGDHYPARTIADAPTTTFTIDVDGARKRVRVEALAELQPSGGDAADRAGLRQLGAVLADFGEYVRQGNATDAGSYEPVAYRVALVDGPPPADALPWPLTDIDIDDFRPDGDPPRLTAYLSPEQAAKVDAADWRGRRMTGPDGRGWVASVRPALPDEVAARDR